MSALVEFQKLVDRALGIPLVLAVRGFDRLFGRAQRPPPQAARRVLFLKLWGVGNLAMIAPLARAVKRRWPAARIDFLSLAGQRSFLAGCPWVDEVLEFDHAGTLRPFARLLALLLRIRRRRYDLVFDFEQFLKTTALLARGAGAGCTVGFRTAGQRRHGLHDVEVALLDQRHMALGYADLLRAAHVEVAGLPPLFVPRSTAAARRVAFLVDAWRSDGRPLVALHVGSGDNFPGRRWPLEAFARLADLLAETRGATIVFTGIAAERRLVRRCRAAMRRPSRDACALFTIEEFAEFLARVDLLVSNDSGPVHFGSALGVPLIALYGPNSPDLYGPLSPQAKVFYRRLACSPCITHSNAKTSLCRSPVCLTSIDPGLVAAAAQRLLAAPAPAERAGVR